MKCLKRFFPCLKRFFPCLFPAVAATITVYEFNNRELFDSIHSYLVSKCFPDVNLSKRRNSNTLTFTIDYDKEIPDTFDGIHVKWSLHNTEKKGKVLVFFNRRRKIRYFKLSFDRKHSVKVIPPYLNHILQEAARIKNMNRRKRIKTCELVHVLGSLGSLGSLLFETIASCT